MAKPVMANMQQLTTRVGGSGWKSLGQKESYGQACGKGCSLQNRGFSMASSLRRICQRLEEVTKMTGWPCMPNMVVALVVLSFAEKMLTPGETKNERKVGGSILARNGASQRERMLIRKRCGRRKGEEIVNDGNGD